MENLKTKCMLCGHEVPKEHLRVHQEEDRREIEEYTIGLIKSHHPEWTQADPTCKKCWDYYRSI